MNLMAILTEQTCGEPCWHAREEICRCSCGGRNHGCLRSTNGVRPERTSKINGCVYTLAAVGLYPDLISEATKINKAAGYRSVEKPEFCTQCDDSFWHQYRYTWSETDPGAPARLKTVNDCQRHWPELAGWQGIRGVYALWVRAVMPERPKQLVVDRETGLPLENQNPN